MDRVILPTRRVERSPATNIWYREEFSHKVLVETMTQRARSFLNQKLLVELVSKSKIDCSRELAYVDWIRISVGRDSLSQY